MRVLVCARTFPLLGGNPNSTLFGHKLADFGRKVPRSRAKFGEVQANPGRHRPNLVDCFGLADSEPLTIRVLVVNSRAHRPIHDERIMFRSPWEWEVTRFVSEGILGSKELATSGMSLRIQWVEICEIGGNDCALALLFPTLGHRPMLTDFGRCCPKFGRCDDRPKSANAWPIPTELGPTLVDVGSTVTNAGPNCVDSCPSLPMLVRLISICKRLFSSCACHLRVWAMRIFPVSFQTYWMISVEHPVVEIRSYLIEIGPLPADSGQHRPTSPEITPAPFRDGC